MHIYSVTQLWMWPKMYNCLHYTCLFNSESPEGKSKRVFQNYSTVVGIFPSVLYEDSHIHFLHYPNLYDWVSKKRKSQTNKQNTMSNHPLFRTLPSVSPSVTHSFFFYQSSYPEKLKSTLRLSMQMLSVPQFISKSSCENNLHSSESHAWSYDRFIWMCEKIFHVQINILVNYFDMFISDNKKKTNERDYTDTALIWKAVDSQHLHYDLRCSSC